MAPKMLRTATVLALACGVCRLAVWGIADLAYVATLAGPARAVEARDSALDGENRAPTTALRSAPASRDPRAASLELLPGGAFVEHFPEMALNPPWATCYVETQHTTETVLEEWVMRGEREVVAAFRSWRRNSEQPTSVRCAETPAEQALRSVCIQCAATEQQAEEATGMPFALSGRVSASGVMTFGLASTQCMAATAKGNGFCKSGQVALR